MNLQIDQQGLLSQLETLATFSDAEPPAVTRIVFTPADLKARAWLISGTLSVEAAAKLKDRDGETVDEVRRKAGFNGNLQDVKLPKSYYKAFVELHIEQGPLLERAKTSLGIVKSIAAPASFRVSIDGAGGHAGGVLMPDRKDALCAAAELILAIEKAAHASGALDTVATVGVCDVFPGAVNSIPSRVGITLDIRDTDLARRDGVMQTIEGVSREIGARRHVSIQWELVNADAPADCAPEVRAALADSCRAHGFPFLEMVSRAYHDSLFVSRIAPTGMLFIPCRNGYSHRPDEYAAPEDIARGALVLAESLATLSGRAEA